MILGVIPVPLHIMHKNQKRAQKPTADDDSAALILLNTLTSQNRHKVSEVFIRPVLHGLERLRVWPLMRFSSNLVIEHGLAVIDAALVIKVHTPQ